jgi:hypothetical protein
MASRSSTLSSEYRSPADRSRRTLDRFRGQWNVGRDHQVALLQVLDDVVIRRQAPGTRTILMNADGRMRSGMLAIASSRSAHDRPRDRGLLDDQRCRVGVDPDLH